MNVAIRGRGSGLIHRFDCPSQTSSFPRCRVPSATVVIPAQAGTQCICRHSRAGGNPVGISWNPGSVWERSTSHRGVRVRVSAIYKFSSSFDESFSPRIKLERNNNREVSSICDRSGRCSLSSRMQATLTRFSIVRSIERLLSVIRSNIGVARIVMLLASE